MAESPRPSISTRSPRGRTARVGGKIAHRADRLDLPVAAEHERVLDHPHVAERGAAERAAASRRRDLREVADQQAGHGTRTTTRATSAPPRAAMLTQRQRTAA